MEEDEGGENREREWKSGREQSYREWRTLAQKTLSAQSARYFSLLMNPAGGAPLEKHFYFCRSVYHQSRQIDRQTVYNGRSSLPPSWILWHAENWVDMHGVRERERERERGKKWIEDAVYLLQAVLCIV